MKRILLSFILICLYFFSYSQETGRIWTSNKTPKAGDVEEYFYKPPKGLLLPDSLEALIMYETTPYSNSNFVELKKNENEYRFSFRAKDSVAVLLIVILDARMKLSDFSPLVLPKKKVIDNNNGQGFVVHLFNEDGKPFADDAIQMAVLLPRWVYYTDMKDPDNSSLLTLYEAAYQKHPELKKQDSYTDYLSFLYKVKKENAKPVLVNYAAEKIKNGVFETDLLNARKIYFILKTAEEQQKAEELILQKYPAGELAKEKYWQKQYNRNNKEKETEESVLKDLNEYISQFNDSSKKDYFYQKIISLKFDNADWVGGLKYEELINEKSSNAYVNNRYALKLADPALNKPGDNLEVAKLLSGAALAYIKEYEVQSAEKEGSADLVKYFTNNYFNTYAIILYKLQQYDSAFYYQDAVYKLGDILSATGMERYAVYSEKVKGLEYTRNLLEHQLLNGANTPLMLAHLQAIYKKLDLPEDQLKVLQSRNKILAANKNASLVKKIMGATQAPAFTLKNLKGESVSLAALKNKVVVLDFWATWCAPCKASFPEMNKLVNKYKDDEEVVFLFIDVWESMEPGKLKETVTDYMTENKYDFNVLFDEKKKIASDYKLISIPTKLIIDKNGEIVFIGNELNHDTDISQIIDAFK